MSKKLVFELSIYTDGDWRYNESMFEGYTSRYFDTDLYEYTRFNDYTMKIRRTFDNVDSGFDKIVDILTKLRVSIDSSRDVDDVRDFFQEQITNAEAKEEFNDFFDGNTEIEIEVRIVESDSKRIKQIIYEE